MIVLVILHTQPHYVGSLWSDSLTLICSSCQRTSSLQLRYSQSGDLLLLIHTTWSSQQLLILHISCELCLRSGRWNLSYDFKAVQCVHVCEWLSESAWRYCWWSMSDSKWRTVCVLVILMVGFPERKSESERTREGGTEGQLPGGGKPGSNNPPQNSLTRLRTASHVAREQMLPSQIAQAQTSCVKRAISRSTVGRVHRCEVISRKVL